MTVQTGKELGSGTDATVYISLFGEKSKIQRYALKKPKSGKNPFEKGQKDEFVFDEDDVGKVCFLSTFFHNLSSIFAS